MGMLILVLLQILVASNYLSRLQNHASAVIFFHFVDLMPQVQKNIRLKIPITNGTGGNAMKDVGHNGMF